MAHPPISGESPTLIKVTEYARIHDFRSGFYIGTKKPGDPGPDGLIRVDFGLWAGDNDPSFVPPG